MTRLQGLWLDDAVVRRVPDETLRDGAGNAFAATVCGAAWLTLLLAMADVEGL